MQAHATCSGTFDAAYKGCRKMDDEGLNTLQQIKNGLGDLYLMERESGGIQWRGCVEQGM
jgi:hypothetical protein